MIEGLLDSIRDTATEDNIDSRAYAEQNSYEQQNDQRELTENDLLKAQVLKLALKNSRYKDNTEIRKSLVVAFTTIIVFWLVAVLLILVGNNSNNYQLSENTLIALLVTSSANVIGMMVVILKNLFPQVQSSSKPSQ